MITDLGDRPHYPKEQFSRREQFIFSANGKCQSLTAIIFIASVACKKNIS
jgi:hypothetical protein